MYFFQLGVCPKFTGVQQPCVALYACKLHFCRKHDVVGKHEYSTATGGSRFVCSLIKRINHTKLLKENLPVKIELIEQRKKNPVEATESEIRVRDQTCTDTFARVPKINKN